MQSKFFSRCSVSILHRTIYNVVQINLLLIGIVQGETTARLVREIGVDS